MANLTRRELARAISEREDIPQVLAYRIVGQFLDEMIDALGEGRRIELRGFGTFRVIERKARKIHVPDQGELQLPARPDVSFQPGKDLNDRLQEGFSP